MRLWKSISVPGLDLIFPPVCLACGRRIDSIKELLCEPCHIALTMVDEAGICPKCGSDMQHETCDVCHSMQVHFDLARAVFRFEGPIQNLVHALKYEGRRKVAEFFAHEAANYIKTLESFGEADLLIPVPLHKVRARERGYNQSALIAKKLAALLSIEYAEPVYRKRYTKSQTHLHRDERLQNLASAFGLTGAAKLENRKLLLVDDVFTTGSTVNEICGVLQTAAPKSIMVLTMARAIHHDKQG